MGAGKRPFTFRRSRRIEKTEQIARTLNRPPLRQILKNAKPGGRELPAPHGIVDCRNPHAHRIGDGLSSYGVCKLSGIHRDSDNTNGVVCQAPNWLFEIMPVIVNTLHVTDRKTYPEIAARLTALRTAFSDATKTDWALREGFQPTQYINWENGTRRISLDAAELLAARYGLTLDWIYRGRMDGLSDTARKALSSRSRK